MGRVAAWPQASALARAGADFVAVEGAVWNAEDGPASAVVALNAALGNQRSAA